MVKLYHYVGSIFTDAHTHAHYGLYNRAHFAGLIFVIRWSSMKTVKIWTPQKFPAIQFSPGENFRPSYSLHSLVKFFFYPVNILIWYIHVELKAIFTHGQKFILYMYTILLLKLWPFNYLSQLDWQVMPMFLIWYHQPWSLTVGQPHCQ